MPFADREKQLEYWRKYGLSKRRATKNSYYQKWYSENRDSVLERNRRWRKENKYRSQSNTIAYRKIAIGLLLERDGHNCGVCGQPLNGDAQTDHIVPRCIGGKDMSTNLRLAHRLCNIRRERKFYE